MATKPVIVGVDGSEESLLAVEWAALEARRHSSPLRIVSAPDVVPRMHAYHASPAEIAAALRGVSARAVDVAITRSEEVAPGLPVDTGLLSGPPAVAVAESGSGASMLVVGARGGRRVRGDDARLGEPVRRRPGSLPGRGGPGGDHGRAPRDRGGRPRSARCHRNARVRVRRAALRGADMVAVHTWYWLPPARGEVGALRPADPERFAAEAARHLAAALEDWHGKYPGVRVRQDVIRGHPGRVLASYSARTDLVVLGRHGHPAGPGPGIGSVQHAVLDHAHGPVAVVPSGD